MAVFVLGGVVVLAAFIRTRGNTRSERRRRVHSDNDGYYRGPNDDDDRYSRGPHDDGDRTININIRHRRSGRCTRCSGTGKVKRELPEMYRNALGVSQTERCSECRGSGILD